MAAVGSYNEQNSKFRGAKGVLLLLKGGVLLRLVYIYFITREKKMFPDASEYYFG